MDKIQKNSYFFFVKPSLRYLDFPGHLSLKDIVPQESVVAETLTEIAIELSFVFNVQPTFWKLTQKRFAHH